MLGLWSLYRNPTAITSQSADSFHCIRNDIGSHQLSLGSLRVNQNYIYNSVAPYQQASLLSYATQAFGSIYDHSNGMNIPATDTTSGAEKGWAYDFFGLFTDLELCDCELGGLDSSATLGLNFGGPKQVTAY